MTGAAAHHSSTWRQLAKKICSHYGEVHDGGEWLRIHWCGTSPQASGSTQIIVFSADVADIPCVTMVARVCAEASLSHTDALYRNGVLLAGSLMLRDGTYLFRLSVPMRAPNLVQITNIVEFVATQAIRVQELVVPTDGIDLSGFAWISE